MTKIVGPSAFLNEFGVRNERVKILHWLDRHGGVMELKDVLDASTEPDNLVIHRIAEFASDGFLQCTPEMKQKDEGGLPQLGAVNSSTVVLTEQGRALLKYV